MVFAGKNHFLTNDLRSAPKQQETCQSVWKDLFQFTI